MCAFWHAPEARLVGRHFLEENVMEMFYGLMGLEHSVNLQRWVIKAVIRALRLRYELLDNGSIARIVLKMAERLEYSAKRFQFAIVHCEFLYTLCDKVLPPPLSSSRTSSLSHSPFLVTYASSLLSHPHMDKQSQTQTFGNVAPTHTISSRHGIAGAQESVVAAARDCL